jgi:Holliday junction resolvase RusA-like endonuclease
MSQVLAFFCAGHPKTSGSKSAIPYRKNGGGLGVRVMDSCKTSKDWKAIVAMVARQHWKNPPLTGPLKVTMEFQMARPKAHFKRKGELREGAPHYHQSRPDALKLSRCVEDSLIGLLWLDDSQIALEVLSKTYHEIPGVRVIVEQL